MPRLILILFWVVSAPFPAQADTKPEMQTPVSVENVEVPVSSEICETTDQEIMEVFEFLEMMELLEDMELLDNFDALIKEE